LEPGAIAFRKRARGCGVKHDTSTVDASKKAEERAQDQNKRIHKSR
jgi:hypothetical protein